MATSVLRALKEPNVLQQNDVIDDTNKHELTTVLSDTENERLYRTQINPLTTEPSLRMTSARTRAVTMTTTLVTSNLVSALTIDKGESYKHDHHNIMVAILMAIFMCISLTIATAIFVFCRKKNSVFMLQKCEQDSDYEMNDINTEVNTSDSDADTFDSEYEFIECSSPETSKRQKLQKSDSSPCEFITNYKPNNLTLSLSSSFPDLTKCSNDRLKVDLSTKSKTADFNGVKDDKRSQKKQKERTKYKHRLKERDQRIHDKTSMPLLIPKCSTGSDKNMKHVPYCKKSLRTSQSMPTIEEHTVAKQHQIRTAPSVCSSKTVSQEVGKVNNTTLDDSSGFQTKPKSKMKISNDHFYCIVEINEPREKIDQVNWNIFDA